MKWGPSNDSEVKIAREVDKLAGREELNLNAVSEILALVDFELLERDYYFLKEYIRWRMANPIVK